MAAIHDLLAQVQDEALRERLEQEIDRMTKTKKFGLVFEEHLPECTPLYDIPVKKGTHVAKKAGAVSDMYEVVGIRDGIATCYHKVSEEMEEIPVEELVTVAEFGEPIYPYLKPIDSVCNAPDSDLWHVLIEADNYHALQLLEYLYAGKVDCIYIDPPYNTGAKDWKYNNDYVDGADAYRHSKWLSMMQKRLKLAKKLLNPNDSVLIVTIDEKEYLHLGCLLEEVFPEARIQMITSIIKPEGTQRRNEFSRTNEFLFFVMLGEKYVQPYSCDMVSNDIGDNDEDGPLPYRNFRRTNSSNVRASRPNQFYPIFIDVRTGKIARVGNVMTPDVKQEDIEVPEGQEAVFPVRDTGEEMIWYRTPSAFQKTLEDGYAYAEKTKKGYIIKYLSSGIIKQIEDGTIVVTGKNEKGELLGHYKKEKLTMPKTVWTLKSHIARDYGSLIIKKIFDGDGRFTFPKSLYAVEDCLKMMLSQQKDALIVDFFAGSGTTLHAVNLLNAEDGGHRRCIMVTNNEVSDAEAKSLTKQGFKPGDEEWEKLGIARYVTWPRTVCSIEGHDVNGKPLKGNYLTKDVDGSDIPMADGFKANAAYFKLGFLDKTSVALGRQLAELIPVLWLKAGAVGPCPQLTDENSNMLILPENHFAILINEKHYRMFSEEIQKFPEIRTIYIVTDSEAGYREMIAGFDGKDIYQLYRDYLDNFRINTGR